MAYTFDQVFAADPANPANIAQNASITIFAPGDGTMAPIAITDPDGQPLANPIPVNANGFGSAFMADIDRVAWLGGGFTGFFTSYDGMKEEAVAARAAAETASSGAAAAAQADLEARIASGVFKGAKGDPGTNGTNGVNGSNVLPTQEAIEQAIINPGPAKTTLDTTYAGVAGKKKGGNVLKPVRMPALHIEREWPNATADHRILWAQDSTVYAEGTDKTLRKSTDGGRNWTAKTFNFSMSNYRGLFLKTASGALLQVRNNTPLQFYRSTDDGATWVAGTQCRTNGLFLTAQSWAQDPVTGYIYAVEYHTSDGTFADVRVYRSTDDGVTFTVWYTFPGPTSSDANKVRHGHSVQWDSVSQRIYISMGDADNAAGIYRVTADGTTLEPIVTRAMLAAAGITAVANLARAIGIMWFPTHIAWGVDEPDGEIVRMARTEIGQSAPVIERIYGITSGGWGSTKASADGSVWLTFGSAEQEGGIALDRNMHVYAVSDNGATVWEVGSIPAAGQAFAAPTAIGQAELHSDVLWFGTRGMDVGVMDRFYKAQMGVGFQQIGSSNSARPLYYGAPESVSGDGSLALSGQKIIGYTKAPLTAHRLYILGMGAKATAGTGSLRVRAYRKDNNSMLVESSSPNVKGGITRLEAAEYVYTVDLPADTEVEFRLQEVGGVNTVDGVGHVTFAWGL